MDGGDGCTTMRIYLMPPNRTFKDGQDGTFYVIYILPQLKNNYAGRRASRKWANKKMSEDFTSDCIYLSGRINIFPISW